MYDVNEDSNLTSASINDDNATNIDEPDADNSYVSNEDEDESNANEDDDNEDDNEEDNEDETEEGNTDEQDLRNVFEGEESNMAPSLVRLGKDQQLGSDIFLQMKCLLGAWLVAILSKTWNWNRFRPIYFAKNNQYYFVQRSWSRLFYTIILCLFLLCNCKRTAACEARWVPPHVSGRRNQELKK